MYVSGFIFSNKKGNWVFFLFQIGQMTETVMTVGNF